MNRKQVLGLVLLFIGILMVIFSIQSMDRSPQPMGAVKSCWNRCEDRIAMNSQKDPKAIWILTGGIALGVVGTSMAAFGKKKKTR